MNKKQRADSIIEKLSRLNKERTGYIFSLVHGKAMTYGLPHEVFRKCGKKNCKCAEGKLHGPYAALSVTRGGGKKIVMIKKRDVSTTLKEARRYQYFRKTLAKIRNINREIDTLLCELKSKTIRDYP